MTNLRSSSQPEANKGAKSITPSVLYDSAVHKQHKNLYKGNTGLCLATELVANGVDHAIKAFKAMKPHPDQLKSMLPSMKFTYFEKGQQDNNHPFPYFLATSNSTLDFETAGEMLNFTGGDEDGKAMRSSEYGQGAKIAFLSVDDKIIAEIIALERVTEQGADDKTHRGSVTQYRIYPEGEEGMMGMPKDTHGNTTVRFYVYEKDDEVVWLCPEGESGAPANERSDLMKLFDNTMHVVRRARDGSIDQGKSKTALENVILKEVLPMSAESCTGSIVAQFMTAESWVDNPKIRNAANGDIEFRINKVKEDADGGRVEYLPDEFEWVSFAKPVHDQWPTLDVPQFNLPGAEKELIKHRRDITFGNKKIGDIVPVDPFTSKVTKLVVNGLQHNPSMKTFTKQSSLFCPGIAAILRITLHPTAHNMIAGTELRPGMSVSMYKERPLSDGIVVFHLARVLNQGNPHALFKGALCNYVDAQNKMFNWYEFELLGQTNKETQYFCKVLIEWLGFRPTIDGKLNAEEASEFAILVPGGLDGLFTILTTPNRAARSGKIGLKPESRTDIFAKLLCRDIIGTLDCNGMLDASKRKFVSHAAGYNLVKQCKREAFMFVTEHDPVIKSMFDELRKLRGDKMMKFPIASPNARNAAAAALPAAALPAANGADGEQGNDGEGAIVPVVDPNDPSTLRGGRTDAQREQHRIKDANYKTKRVDEAPDHIYELMKDYTQTFTGLTIDELMQGDWDNGTVEYELRHLLSTGSGFVNIEVELNAMGALCRHQMFAILQIQTALKSCVLTEGQKDKLLEFYHEAADNLTASGTAGSAKGGRPRKRKKSDGGETSAAGASASDTNNGEEFIEEID